LKIFKKVSKTYKNDDPLNFKVFLVKNIRNLQPDISMGTVLNDMMKSMDIFVNANRGELIFYGIIVCQSPILLRWFLPPVSWKNSRKYLKNYNFWLKKPICKIINNE
jgi:hypothetical protein